MILNNKTLHKPNKPRKTRKIELPSHVGVHCNLALEVSKTKDANLQRAFGLWAVLRSNNRTWYTNHELTAIARKTGKSARTIKRWIASGVGTFWHKRVNFYGERVYDWSSRDKVMNVFNLINPGVVLTIQVADLLPPKLKHLRACLKDLFISKQSKYMSRETIQELTGVDRRTQQKYDNESGLHRQYCCTRFDWTAQSGKHYEVRQIANIYHNRFERYHQKSKSKRYGLYVPDVNAMDCPDANQVGIRTPHFGRFFFDDKSGAYDKVEAMLKKGDDGFVLYKSGVTSRGSVITSAVHTNDFVQATAMS